MTTATQQSATDRLPLACTGCAASVQANRTKADNARLPRGWKRVGGETLCGPCVKARFRVLAVELPVMDVVGEGQTWEAFAATVADCWEHSTALANWSVDTLHANDVRRKPADTKLAKMPNVYLYGIFNREYHDRTFWTGAAGQANCVLKTAERYYRKDRWHVLWAHRRNLRQYRFPYPYPVDQDGWGVEYGATGEPLASVSFPGGRLTLRLRQGPEWRRQLALFRQIAEGRTLNCEAQVLGRKIGGTSGKVVEFKRPGSPYKELFRVMLKLVAYFPRGETGERRGTVMQLRTDKEHFLIADVDGREPWILNAEHLRRQEGEARAEESRHERRIGRLADADAKRQAERKLGLLARQIERHADYLQRMSDDTKYEKRWPKDVRVRLNQARELRCDKQHHRLDSSIKEVAALTVNYAKRQHVSEIRYDGVDRGYLLSFPWSRLETQLKAKADEAGIDFVKVAASGEEAETEEAGE